MLLTAKTRPCHKTILKETLTSKIRKVIALTDKSRNPWRCGPEEEKVIQDNSIKATTHQAQGAYLKSLFFRYGAAKQNSHTI